MNLKKFITILKDIIAPKICYSCKKEWHFLCDKCLLEQKNFGSKCFLCWKNTNYFNLCLSCNRDDVYFDQAIILMYYKGNLIQKIIRDWKYNQRKDIFEDLWEILAKTGQKYVEKEFDKLDKKDIIITCPPMHFIKSVIRWFNQAQILAESFSEHLWIKSDFKIIKKLKHTKSQTKHSKEWRSKNVLWIFWIQNKKKLMWKTVFLVDDVITTWSTLNEVSKELKSAWVKQIVLFIIASQ